MMRHLRALFASLSLALLAGCAGIQPSAPARSAVPVLNPNDYVLTVNTTCQDYSFVEPWRKTRPYSRSGKGILVNGKMVLVPANLVRNHNYVELETLELGEKAPAKVVHVDYFANLAFVAPEDPEFLKDMKSLQVAEKLLIGNTADVWQFEDNGKPIVSTCKLHRVHSGFSLLQYRFTGKLPGHVMASSGLPIVSDGKLVGVLTSYSGTSETIYSVSAQVINHFMRDMKQGEYQGFPSTGFGFSLINDPALRDFIKLPKEHYGVYVTYVRPKSPAAEAGVKKGDVILGIDGFDLDRKGHYQDPDYGDLHFSHLLSTKSYTGTKRIFHVWRDGKKVSLETTLRYVPTDTYPVPPYIYDRGPEYLFVGGVVIQELSREYLKSWKGWRSSAPQRLVHYERNQWELAKPDTKPVIISIILPAPGNQGLENFNFKLIKTVNGVEIKSLRDVRKALKAPVSKNGKSFHRFTFQYRPNEMMLDLSRVKQDNRLLKEQYQIPVFERFYE